MAKKTNPESKLFREKKSIWQDAKKADVKRIYDFAQIYKDFISKAKTEREMVTYSIEELEAAGFKEISKVKTLKPGTKVYKNIRCKGLFAAVIGKEPLENGPYRFSQD